MKKSEIFDILVKKVANDNIIVLNDKIDAIAKLLSYDEGESTDAQANKKQ